MNSVAVERHHHRSIVTHTAATYEQHTYTITCAPKGGATFVSSKAQDQETDNRTKFTVRLPCPVRYTQYPILYGRTWMAVL